MSTGGPQLFNSALEAGLRSLFLLAASGRRGFDIQQLVGFDFALVHSSELDGPPSLHPRSPAQGQQLLVRRTLMQDGLELMRSRDLVDRKFQASGIVYGATRAGRHVAAQFDSLYAKELRERANWVVETLADLTARQLAELLDPQARALADELIVAQSPGELSLMSDD
ncbi:MAG TPA: ABC-three component system middle component 2 [Solirubrobacteraceae bacterium]|nr:ABC-three component system middle component 2 [Solirubrobacteraceae bacterium]